MATIKISEKGSIKGYDWLVWLDKHKDDLFVVIASVLAILSTRFGFVWWLQILTTVFTGAGSLWLMNLIDFVANRVKL